MTQHTTAQESVKNAPANCRSTASETEETVAGQHFPTLDVPAESTPGRVRSAPKSEAPDAGTSDASRHPIQISTPRGDVSTTMPAQHPLDRIRVKTAALELLTTHADERDRLDRTRAHIITAARDAGLTWAEIAEALRVSLTTVYRAVKQADDTSAA